MSSRHASHAGSWYKKEGPKLEKDLQDFLSNVEEVEVNKPVRGLIGPHAGYSYSGPTAAWAYKYLDSSECDRIFILGPSHHFYMAGCALTACDFYETPFGRLKVDKQLVQELFETEEFEYMDRQVDEDEHSIEMHLPYIYHIMQNRPAGFTIVPVLVGNLSSQSEASYGKIFSRYLADPRNFFVISSDFCHWGRRFSFTHYDKSCGEIYQSIEALDREGIKLIEEINPQGFVTYLKAKRNTICGRHPIAIFLHAINFLKKDQSSFKPIVKFTRYAQSSRVLDPNDSSVSYASAVLYSDKA